MPYADVPLQLTVGGYADGVRTLTAAVPPSAPFELYDLRLTGSGGVSDVLRHCVRVIPAYRDTFTFVHLPDCHLPSVAWIGFYDDRNTVPELSQILQELAYLNPEFVLQTGDLVDDGQIGEHYRIAQSLLEQSQVPFFLTGGNHDLWYDGHELWRRYFGAAMDYTFLYGGMRFVGLEMYDIPSPTFPASQMKWLRDVLDESISAREGARIIFTHYDQSGQLTSDFLDQYLVDAVIYGHTHVNNVRTVGTRQSLMLNTSFTMNDNGEYRLLKVRDGRIVDFPVLKCGRLWVNTYPAQDGSSWKAGALIRNDNDVDLDGVLVKLHVRRDAAPFAVAGGAVLQAIDHGSNQRVYYVRADVARRSQTAVTVTGQSTGNEPPTITSYTPRFDTTVVAGQTVPLRVQVEDEAPASLSFTWRTNGTVVPGQQGASFNFAAPLDFAGTVEVELEVSDGTLRDTHSWRLYVEPAVARPMLLTSTRNFFPYDREVVLRWQEPFPGQAVFEYGRSPGAYTGSIAEQGSNNQVHFVPREVGMGLGVYFCRIRLDALASDEFTLVVEAPSAPRMISPLGPVRTLSPTFQWEPVEGVPYYLVIMTDQKISIVQDPVTGDYSIEGANPLWAVLTSEHGVPYGVPDPSGTFTSAPAPLAPAGEYWWVVLNCYGPTPELSSTAQSGVGSFRVDLPLPNMRAPALLSPADNASLSGPSILFRWEAVRNAVVYHFYPFKIEVEAGVQVVRPIWESVIATTNTALDLPAARLLVKGDYLWKVAAVATNGVEVPSLPRAFRYDAPAATVNLRTLDNRGTEASDDDIPLPRTTVTYDALVGVDLGLPLATDTEGRRNGVLFAPGVYLLRAQREGYAPLRDTLVVATGKVYDVALRLQPDPAAVRGDVRDQTGQAVAAATVRAVHSLRTDLVREGATNQLGQFSLALPPGSWRVSATKSGFRASAEVAVEVKAGEAEELPAPLVVTRNRNALTGAVVNDAGVPVYGATVVATSGSERLQAATDASGRFCFSLFDGSWVLQASKAGFVSSAQRGVSVAGGTSYQISPPLAIMPMAALVAGVVTDGLAPLAQAEIRAIPLAGQIQSGTSDGYGCFSLSLSAGTYTLEARKSGFTSAGSQVISLAPGETVSGIELLLLPNAGSISGTVTTDGVVPLVNGTVSAGGQSAATDAGGRYLLSVPPGVYAVMAKKEGYLDPAPVEVTVGAGQSVQGVNFLLPPHASVIKGRVLYGSGVAGAVVRAIGPGQKSTMSDDNGNYSLGVEPGVWTLTAQKAGFSSETVTVEVGQAQVLEGQNIRLSRSVATLQGAVLDAGTGSPIPSASLVVDPGGLSTTSRQDGSFKIELDPQPSGVTVTATKPGYAPLARQTGPLQAGNTATLELALTPLSTRLAGTIFDEFGARVSAARVLAVAGPDTFATTSSQSGTYVLPVSHSGGTFAVFARKPGYVWDAPPVTVTLRAGEERTVDLAIRTHFAGLRGRTLSAREGAPVSAAAIRLQRGAETIASTVSDQVGEFQFVDDKGRPFLTEGTYDLWAGKQGFADTVVTGVALRGGSTASLDLPLRRHEAWLEGVVSDGNAPLSDALVIAEKSDGTSRFTAVSRSNGAFRIAPIAPGEYRLSAQLTGYTWARDTVVSAPQGNIALRLTANAGRIWGTVIDVETNQGLPGASIFVGDGHGNEARTSSQSDGQYELQALPVFYPYQLTVSKSGYRSVVRTVSATKGDTTDFRLARVYGAIGGKVTLKSGEPVQRAIVQAQAGATAFKDTTDATGRYGFARLTANAYQVSVTKAGHLSTPRTRTVSLYNGGDSLNVNFVLDRVGVASVAISGPVVVTNDGTASFSFSATTSDGREVPIEAQWSVDHPAAVEALSENGRLTPKRDYIGPLCLMLRDAFSGVADSLLLQVVATVNPNGAARVLTDYRGATFSLPAACVASPLSLGLSYPNLPDVKKRVPGYQIAGRTYALRPGGITLRKPMVVTLPVPDSSAAGCALFAWNPSRLAWEELPSVAVSGGLQAEVSVLGQWAVMQPSLPLGIREFKAEPTPFSPFVAPLQISFRPTSQSSSVVFVTIKVYNMTGELARRLTEAAVPQGQRFSVTWDGRTDGGAMALNGRYLLHIEVKDGEGSKKMLTPVVLVK
ncbi:MAG: carboxypeptidase regulatory-like domain-containing protein [bacterium]|nr:carboxypeptidase regulatory-like domain-containing protein [bacterium]